MKGYAFYNGNIAPCDEIKIPLTDRLIYFGDGIYDVIIGRDGRLFLGDKHIERFFCGMRAVNIPQNICKSDIYNVIGRLIELSGYKSYMIYISVSRDGDERMHSYKSCSAVNFLVIIKEFELSKDDDIKLITEEDKRYFFCNIKTTNLLPAVLASSRADFSGCDEAVFHRGNTVTECAHSNIFILRDNILITHPKCELILPGIMRGALIDIAEKIGIKVNERAFDIDELFAADEVIVTSTTKLIKRAVSIDGIEVGQKNTLVYSKLKSTMLESYANS